MTFLNLEMDEDGNEPVQNGMVNGHSHENDTPSDPNAASKPNVRLSYDDYKQMANLLVIYIRQEEEKRGEGMYCTTNAMSPENNFQSIPVKVLQVFLLINIDIQKWRLI